MWSCSSSTNHWIYDVFLSFRGEDTRNTLVADLYAALSNKGILTFIDDELPRGMGIQKELERAIEGSRISIVVFSKNYASSSWCLHELLKIMDCSATYNQMVVPVFYDVDPSHVRHQTGDFGAHLHSLEATPDMLRKWKTVLTKAANISGWDASIFSQDHDLVDHIVEDISRKIAIDILSIPKFLVEFKPSENQLIKFIGDQSGRGCLVGILGMGGLGKTTMAKVIYNRIHWRFMHRCFIENIRETGVKNSKDFIDLQENLLSALRINTREKIHSSEKGKALIEKSLVGKRALIVLDDVTDVKQVEALCGNIESILKTSVIIITTRDERLLNVLPARNDVAIICKMKELEEKESLKLFRWHAFRGEIPTKDLIKLTARVVGYCGGLPLALEVLGSYLLDRKKEEWKDVLSKLKKIPNDKVQEKLKISYDGLDYDQKKVFLDVCFFFIGKSRADVTEILKGCDLHPVTGIATLVERCLIKLDEKNKLNMHDLIRDMGREIVRQSYEEEPEKRSRLWVHQEVLDVLSDETGTKAIEGLILKSQTDIELHFNTKAFEKMKKLRLLKLDNVQLDGDYMYLNKNLRWVCWERFPLKDIPCNLHLGNVISIELKYSNIRQLWKEPQSLPRLKILNLSHSRYLRRTPDFSKMTNLSKLILKDCPSLFDVHESIGDLNNLLILNLMDCTSLSEPPRSMYRLKSVETLILSGCSKIDKLEEDIEQMESLTTLIAKDTAIEDMPHSIVRLKSIGYISLCGLEGLARDIFPSLIWSWMSPTANLGCSTQLFGSTSTSLISMDIRHKNCGDDLLPMLRGVSNLRCILVQCNSDFQLTHELRKIMEALCEVQFTDLENTSYPSQISETPVEYYLIGMGRCDQVINMLSQAISEGLRTNIDSSGFSLPGNNYPYWLAYIGQGHSADLRWPEESDCCMKAVALCVVYSSTCKNVAAECLTGVLIVNYTKCTFQIYKRDTITSFNDEDWQGIVSNLKPGDNVEIYVALGHGLTVLKTAIYLIYGQPSNVKMEQSLNVNRPLSPNVTVDLSTNTKTDTSPNVQMKPLPNLKSEPSTKPKKNIFARLTKGMEQLSCFKGKKGFNKF